MTSNYIQELINGKIKLQGMSAEVYDIMNTSSMIHMLLEVYLI